MRRWLIDAISESMNMAIAARLGFFIAMSCLVLCGYCIKLCRVIYSYA